MRRVFEGGAYLNILPGKIYFFYFFIQRHTFYLLIFLWTDTKTDSKSRITREIHAVKKPESFMITRAKISAVRASGVWRLFEGSAYSSKYGIFREPTGTLI